MNKVQRLNSDGLWNIHSLRYSLVPWLNPDKYSESWGISEYLIEQLQFTGSEAFSSTAVRQKLNFNHPVKEIVWVAQLDSVAAAKGWSDFTSSGANHLVDAKLLLNGQDRFSTRKAGYFNLVQPDQHHTRGPSVGIYDYSFALKPEEHQPSGSVNMSRIDNATMQLSFASSAAMKLYTYARNYNVFRIVSGMGGLAYAAWRTTTIMCLKSIFQIINNYLKKQLKEIKP